MGFMNVVPIHGVIQTMTDDELKAAFVATVHERADLDARILEVRTHLQLLKDEMARRDPFASFNREAA